MYSSGNIDVRIWVHLFESRSIYTTTFNINKFYVFLSECIDAILKDVWTNSDYLPIHRQIVLITDAMCLLRGTDWIHYNITALEKFLLEFEW